MPAAVLASRSRSAWVGYSEMMLAAWPAANANRPSTQTPPRPGRGAGPAAAAGRCRRTRCRPHPVLTAAPPPASAARRWRRPRRPGSGAGTAPPASAAGWSGCARPAAVELPQHRVERGRCPPGSAPGVPSTCRSCTPGSPASPVGGPASSAGIEVRVRWRSSASVPVSTVRPSRMMLTRSHSASTSARMWLDSRTVRPRVARSSAMTCRNTPPSAGRGRRSARRAAAARRRRRARRPGRPSAGCPWSRCGPSCAGRGRSAPAARSRRLRVQAAAQPAEQVDDLAAGEVGPQGDVAGHVGQPAVQGDGVAPGVAAEQLGMCRRRRAAGRAGPGWWWSCRRRWGRGSRAPPRAGPPGPARRGRGSGRTS